MRFLRRFATWLRATIGKGTATTADPSPEHPLVEYLRRSEFNTATIGARSPLVFDLLKRVQAAFDLALASVADQPSRSVFMLPAAGASFLAAVRLASGAQIVEPYKSLRACLEAAHYAVLLHADPAAWALWRSRHESEDGRQKVGKQFSVRRINRLHLAPLDGRLAELALDLHEQTIDLGAHFNIMAFDTAMKVVDRDARLVESSVLTSDESEVVMMLMYAAMTGTCALRVFGLIYPDRWLESGLTAELNALSASFEAVSAALLPRGSDDLSQQ